MIRINLQPTAGASGPGPWYKIALGLAVSAGCIGVLLWLIDWRQAAMAVATLNMWWLALASLLLAGCYLAFAVRWWVLLRCDPALAPNRLFPVLLGNGRAVATSTGGCVTGLFGRTFVRRRDLSRSRKHRT